MDRLSKHLEDRIRRDPAFAVQVYNSTKTEQGRAEFEKKFEAMASRSDWHRVLYAVEPRAEVPRLRLAG